MSSTSTVTTIATASDRTPLLTADEVAAELRVTPRTVRRWARDGLIEPIHLGGRLVRYAPGAVEALIRSGR
jgi:excisionase family DNA binding protein